MKDETLLELRRFGCLAYVKVEPADQVKKLKPNGTKVVFLGFSKFNG